MRARLDHIVLNVEDVEEMIRFYVDVLGLAAERLEAFRQGVVPFPSVRINRDAIIDLFPRPMWDRSGNGKGTPPNLNHLCLAMEPAEWKALASRLEAKGVTIEEGPVQRWGAHGTGTSVYFQDPEANLIEARYYGAPDESERCLLGS